MKQILGTGVGRENNSVVTSEITDGFPLGTDKTIRRELSGVCHESSLVCQHHFDAKAEALRFVTVKSLNSGINEPVRRFTTS
jgi:hypothetical protein